MKVRFTEVEIEADARDLRESNTLGENFTNLLRRCFQNKEPFYEEEDAEEEEV